MTPERRAYLTAYAKAHPEYGRRYRERHRDVIRGRQRERARSPQARAQKAIAARARAATHPANLGRQYRMTQADYDALLTAQGGVCAICRHPPKRTRLTVDHDHACCPGVKTCGRCVRGLLCTACNVGGGMFGDDPARLRAAADYFDRRLTEG